MYYAEMFFNEYCIEMRTLAKLLDDITEKIIRCGRVTQQEIIDLQEAIQNQIVSPKPIEDAPGKVDDPKGG
ncbi:hypothetical protein BOTCAL_0010g00050 [Botryotinia calthae]|uniref:Uncharacterized protein n=1 Tax=Botryotinia calthae TaxID=38488 RepID=A0A4Y8DGK3_9HELO|nr:hypothetical protein BOTCAL_0010g00050 [Botryotinia calthae]